MGGEQEGTCHHGQPTQGARRAPAKGVTKSSLSSSSSLELQG